MTATTADRLPAILTAEGMVRGWSVRRFAAECRLPLRTVQKILSGESIPRVDTLLVILSALGKSLAWLEREGVTPPKRLTEPLRR